MNVVFIIPTGLGCAIGGHAGDATPEQRANWEVCGAGYGIHWPEIDEDLSTEGLLEGYPARDGTKTISTDVK